MRECPECAKSEQFCPEGQVICDRWLKRAGDPDSDELLVDLWDHCLGVRPTITRPTVIQANLTL